MPKLSTQAWENASPIIDAIKAHPFNQQLMRGNLSPDIFAYYINQDSRYLLDYSRCLALIAAKAPAEYVRKFLQYSEMAFVAENQVVHDYFREKFKIQESKKVTPATLSYSNFLLRTAAIEPLEVAIAAVLPCFWVYQEVGLSIAKGSADNNPFARWIETYSSKEFSATVEEAIAIFDKVAEQASEPLRQQMLDAFIQSTWMEWHFWNDAYNKAEFHNEKLWTPPSAEPPIHSARLFP